MKTEQQPVGEVKEKGGVGERMREKGRGVMENYLFQAEGTE